MNILSISADLEAELARRQDEIRFLQNTCSSFTDSEDQDRFRRSIILLLYAHFEGYFKFSLMTYISAVNGEGLKCADVNVSVRAAALTKFFRALRDPSSKHSAFRNKLPNDSKLHVYARNKEFVERTSDFALMAAIIPEDAIDLESNLKPHVMSKNLFMLGFDYDMFDSVEPEVNMLLHYRNEIAHGTTLSGISEKHYLRVREAAFRIMTTIRAEITRSLTEKSYLA